MILIVPPLVPVPPGASIAVRRAMHDAYVAELRRLNPRAFAIRDAAKRIGESFDRVLESLRRGLALLAGITTTICTSWKVEMFKAIHNFSNPGGDTFKVALFKAGGLLVGTYDKNTTNYTDMTGNGDEVPNGNGYATGGVAVANTEPTSNAPGGGVGFTTPSANAQWLAATFTTRGCMYYNNSKATRAVFVYDFGVDEQVVAGTLTIQMPVNDANQALLRLN